MTAIPANTHDPRTDAPAPGLSQSERAAAVQVAQRLYVELAGLIALLPIEQRGASAMSRALNVDRNTCQRLVASTSGQDPDEKLLIRLPGIQGLRQFVQAISASQNSGTALDQLASATAAIDSFEQLIDRIAGSQRRLKQRLEADPDLDGGPPTGPSDDANARRILFKSAAEVVGRWSDVLVSMSIIRPLPEDPNLTETVRVQGRLGHMWRGGAVPFEINAASPDQLALAAPKPKGKKTEHGLHQTLDARPARGDTPELLLPHFCTRPLPRVTTRNLANRVIHMIDAAEDADGQPIDVVVAYRRSSPDKHPATMDPPIGEVSTIVTYPSRRLVFDVFLHRDIASRCMPTLELHLGSPMWAQPIRARWATRFPGGPQLELLGSGLSHASSDAYPRQVELTRHTFDQVGWNPEEFVGYRCDIAYPVWQGAYCMLFDFTNPDV